MDVLVSRLLLPTGTAVTIHGLLNQPLLNGAHGIVTIGQARPRATKPFRPSDVRVSDAA